ncbi:3'5'-cyclic nucleotide phosphodiesterase [Thraustotheca clavata]|uniref:Phosphodiesterase n=1 Tax=Thraustotheca clavata TaxID=74557 RepID=A0A1V9Y6P5_9STRA|nr:3'5'-cyclic nucleotide phosphodiesterase [Thraustotheca clavata]
MSAKIFQMPSTTSRKRAASDSDATSLVKKAKNTTDARRMARRRWKMVQGHVMLSRWLRKTVGENNHRKFRKAQQALMDSLLTCQDDFVDVLIKIREQFISFMDAENCYFYIATPRGVLEFDGQSVYPSTRSRSGLRKQAFEKGLPVHVPTAITSDIYKDTLDGLEGLDVRSYLCIPLMKDTHVVAVAEIFNYRKGLQIIQDWVQSIQSSLYQTNDLTVFSRFVAQIVSSLNISFDKLKRRPSTTSENVINRAVTLIQRMMSVDVCRVYSLDVDSNSLWSRFFDSQPSMSIRMGQGIVGAVAATGKSIHVIDTRADSRWTQGLDNTIGIDVQTLLCTPICGPDNKVNGVLQLLNRRGEATFTPLDMAISDAICTHIGLEIYNSDLRAAISKAKLKAQTLMELSTILFQESDVKVIVSSIVDAVQHPMGAEHVNIFTVDHESNELVLCGDTQIRQPLGQGLLSHVVAEGELVNIHDLNDSVGKEWRNEYSNHSALLAVPIKDATGYVLGVVEMVDKCAQAPKNYFDQEDEALAVGIAYYLAIALNNAISARAAVRRSDALIKMLHVVSTCTDVNSVFDEFMKLTCDILDAEHSVVFLVNHLDSTLSSRGGRTNCVLGIDQGIPGQVVMTGKPVIVSENEPQLDSSLDALLGISTHSLLCVPVVSRDKTIAVLLVMNKRTAPTFHSDDVHLMNAVCVELSSVIERKSLELLFHGEDNPETELQKVTFDFLAQFTDVQRSRVPSPVVDVVIDPSSQNALPSIPKGPDMILLQAVAQWELNPFTMHKDTIFQHTCTMFQGFHLVEHFQIQAKVLQRFIMAVREQYRNVAYHNFHHAFTTLHITFMIVLEQVKSTKSVLESRDIVSLFIGAICHDMNHNGRTNEFHIKAKTSTAMLYNDQSVLENMHAAHCFDTLRRPGHNVLEHLTSPDYIYVRKAIIRVILATDMHYHSNMVQQLHERLKHGVFQADNDSDKELLLNAIVHSADISNPTFTTVLHVKWTELLMVEFNEQYEEEVALGLAPSVFMSTKTNSPEHARMSIAFIDSCVFPLWSIMSDFIEGLNVCIDNMHRNREYWAQKHER